MMLTLEEANSLGLIFFTCHKQRKRDSNRPTFEHVEHGIISDMIEQRCAVSPSSSPPPTRSSSIVGVDLHPSALALDGDYRDTTVPISQALHMVRNADAIIFGYESTGIPKGWVQIPSRSSIDMVAAMSIILNALLGVEKCCWYQYRPSKHKRF